MKKLIATGLAAAFALGMSSISMAKPLSELDLDLSGLAQINASWSEIDGANDELDLARLRLKLGAKPAEHVALKLQFEETNNISGGAWGDNYSRFSGLNADGASDGRIVDMYVDLTYIPEVSARIGQFALPNNYEILTDEYDLETINYSMGVGVFGTRDRGVMLFGQPIPEFGWAIFGTNGSGAITGATNDTGDQANYGLKLDWNPLENLNFKIWGAMAEEDTAAPGLTNEMDAFGIGFNYTYQGFRLTGEYNDADSENAAAESDITEYYVHASYIIPETDLQLVLRYDKLDEDTAGANVTDVDVLTAGFNWNFEKNARVQLMHEFVDESAGMGESDRTDLMLSVRF